jgi:acyl-coenzyme A synthetase/AMP-(fatty) acid ligase
VRAARARERPERTPGYFREYLKQPEATAEAWAGGYFHTGDVVRVDERGRLPFMTKVEEVIAAAVRTSRAVEVEGTLLLHHKC